MLLSLCRCIVSSGIASCGIASIFLLLSVLPGAAIAHDVTLTGNVEQVQLKRVTQSTYALHGLLGLPDLDNKAFISNSGVIITQRGVVVIDSGGSKQVGDLIVEQIKKLTDYPVVAILNTHVHGDHWLGNAAILRAYPGATVYAHTRAIQRLNNGEAREWFELFAKMTENATSDTKLLLPDTGLNGGETLQIDDLELNIHHTGHAHTDNDIMIELPAEKVLFTGDIVEHRRAVSVDVPQDFSIVGQIQAIRYLLMLPVEQFVPGHGESGDREIPESSLRFLEILHASVKRYYEQGMEAYEMREQVIGDLVEFKHWSGMEQIGKLISIVHLQVEAAEFE